MLFKSINPANNKVVWEGKSAGKQDIEKAVAKAKSAFIQWKQTSFEQRVKMITDFTEYLKEVKKDFAVCISEETGKPLWESLLEVSAMINKGAISIQAYQERCPSVENKSEAFIRRTYFNPHGVAAILGPFNLPAHLPNGHIVPALLAGNTVVFKPSEQTPCVGEYYGKCWEKAGLPEGVINLLQGGKEVGERLVSHEGIDGLFFTGSFQTGKAIHKLLAGHPEKILALEMGGNNPLIIDNVSEVQAAVYTAIQSAFITSGQRCVCARRIIVLKGAKGDAFIKAFICASQKIKVGYFLDNPEPFMGPVISQEAGKNILAWQKQLVQKGGKILLELKQVGMTEAMLSPGIIDSTEIQQREDREIFGPLVQIIRVNNINEAFEEANNTQYGLSAGLLSDDIKVYQKFMIEVKAGIMNWNRPLTGASSEAPFGGVGKSGNHRPSAYFAADYCAYPIASILSHQLTMPKKISPGLAV